MNKDIFEGKFKEISGEIKKKWGEITDDELRKTEGNAEALAGIIQQKFGHKKAETKDDVSDFLGTLERKFSPQRASDKLNDKVDQMKAKMKKS